MRTFGIVIVALAIVAAAFVVAVPASAGGSETGEFPHRTFTVERSPPGRPRSDAYVTSILPQEAGEWSVRLDALAGSTVVVEVFLVDAGVEVLEGSSKLAREGETSKDIGLFGGATYKAVFTPYGRAGRSVLSESFFVNQAPVACFTTSPEKVLPNQPVTFDGTCSSDADGRIRLHEWDFGDGTSDRGEIVAHAYVSIDTYVVTLVVTDDRRATGTVSREVRVAETGFSPPHEERGYDADGDGRLDWILLNVSMYFAEDSYASLYAGLYGAGAGPNSSLYLSASDTRFYYAPGGYSTSLTFPGFQINASGIDGPYTVDLFLYDNYRGIELDRDTYVTQAYRHDAFEEIPAILSPPHSEEGLDRDGDTRFDVLAVRVGVAVETAADYSLAGVLFAPDSNGTSRYVASAWISTYLAAGLQSVLLPFDGPTIRLSGLDGPYVVNMSLYYQGYVLLDNDSLETQAYLHSQFDGSGATFAPPFTDRGRDTDGDGRYNSLVVNVSIDVETTGSYDVFSQLTIGDPNVTVYASASLFASPGIGIVELAFDGLALRAFRADGPYRVHVLLFGYGPYGYTLLDEANYVTAAYRHTDFEELPAVLEPPFSDDVIDTDGDGLWNFLVVDVRVNVSDAGEYFLTGLVRGVDPSPGNVSGRGNVTFLERGLQMVRMWFQGFLLNRSGIDGPYEIDIALRRAYDWFPLGNTTHVTAAYDHASFDGPPASLALPATDFGWDLNGNGLYDYLVIALRVAADEAIDVDLTAVLYIDTPYGTTGMFAHNASRLDVGIQEIWLLFSGFDLYRIGVNGLSRVELTLIAVGGYVVLDRGEHRTASYRASEFDVSAIAFVPPHTDRGEDLDGDGRFDRLVVGARLSTQVYGSVYVRASIVGPIGIRLDTSAYDYVEPGIRTVNLYFSGLQINASGVDGPYLVELYATIDYYGQAIDNHTTAAYDASDFESPAIRFAPPHADYGQDTDGDGKFNWLVLDVSVEVSDAASYAIWGQFYAAGGWMVASNGSYLDRGMHILRLEFDGLRIGLSRADGPYDVELRLYDPFAQAHWYAVHRTAAYLASDFDGPSGSFTEPLTESALDTDGDGRYNVLTVEAGVAVVEGASFLVFGVLYIGYQAVYARVSSDLAPGSYVLEVHFDGSAIRAIGYDGPYRIRLELVDTSAGPVVDVREFATRSYRATDFERPATFVQPFLEEGLDTDRDGLFNWLSASAGVSVDNAASYHVFGYLYSPTGRLYVSDEILIDLGEGEHRVELRFSGVAIRVSATDGPYVVQMYLVNDTSGYTFGAIAFYTRSYRYTEFEELAALLDPPHRDFGLDTDADGLFDYLVVVARVNVTSPVELRAQALVYLNVSGFPSYAIALNVSALDVGVHEVWLLVDGIALYISQVSGEIRVTLSLYDNVTGVFLGEANHVTAAYSYLDFERPPVDLAPPYSDHGEDTDGDGLYDFLVVEVPVVVREEREYLLNVYLRVGPYGYLLVASNASVLGVGAHTLTVRFDGPSIYAARADGPYEVFVTLTWFVGLGNWTLLDRYLTNPYTFPMFDPTVSLGVASRRDADRIAVSREGA